MNYFRTIFCFMLLFLITNVVKAQTGITSSIEKIFYDEDQKYGGECILKSSKLSVDGELSMKTFEIEVPYAGEYYLSAWVMNTETIRKNNGLKLFIDDKESSMGNLLPLKEGWQSSKLSDNNNIKTQRLELTSGEHLITFCTTVPEVPPVDFIRLSTNEADAEISETNYSAFAKTVKNSVLPANYSELKQDSTNSLSLYRVLPNPEGDYSHNIEQSFTYTYYTRFYFYAGQEVVLETKKDDPYASDPVMELFNSNDPLNNGSWNDDNSGDGYQAKITCTIQYTGYYYLLLWSWWLGTSGTTSLYLYDSLYASDVTLTHTGWRHDHSSAEELNQFTCQLTGDSRIWIEDQDGFPGKIIAYNDDYNGDGDFDWDLASRVKKVLPSVRSAQLSAYSSYNPSGTCDVYMKCGNSYDALHSHFPNLEDDDAIKSASASRNYNCISWSGGITSYWEWPLNPGSDYYVAGNPLASFDNYYGNTPVVRDVSPNDRSWNYTRSGATSSNNQIDLWSRDGSYTHGSVNAKWSNLSLGNPANDNPHGYDWESKPGSLMRTFHPRNALTGSSYGSVDKYYRSDGTYESLSLNKNNVKEEVAFSEDEIKKLDSLVERISDEVISEVNTKYLSWKETWTDPNIIIYSDPREYARSKEYEELLDFCKKEGNLLPMIIQKFNEGDFFVINLLEDLTYENNTELMNEVKEKNKITGVSNSLRNNWMKYTKKLLSEADELWDRSSDYNEEKMGNNSTLPKKFTIEQNYPNPFNPVTQIQYSLPSQANVSLKIYDILGKEIKVLVDNEMKSEGRYTATWNGTDNFGNSVASGIYLCRLISGTNVQTIKLMLMK
ncbi:MAG: T9SS type A sorting domain-containing protein [Ignavibacteria bacterium]